MDKCKPLLHGVAAMDLSPDGAAIVTLSAAPPAEDGAPAEQEVHVWDLSSGADEPVVTGVVPGAGAYTRPLLSSTSAVSDTKYTLNTPRYSLISPVTTSTPP